MIVDREARNVNGHGARFALVRDDHRDRAALDPGSKPELASTPQACGHNGVRHGVIVAQNAAFSCVSNQSRVSLPVCLATTVPSARITHDVGRAMSA